MDGAATPDTIGRYPVVGEIAAGGFGTVYRAADPLLGRDLAIKVLHPHLARDPGLRARFLGEGRALAGIRHPNLVQVHDAGEADGRVYLVMEYVPGPSLAELAERGPLAPAEVARVVEQVAGALDTLHAAGLVHRDIKPANILRCDDGRAVLLDLGIARRLEDPGLTSSSVLLGTPGYLAPEQLRATAPMGPATDVYQLGATVYALLTGRAPFEGDLSTVMYAVAHEPPPDLGAVRPDLPAHVVAAVTRALAKHPENRPASAGAFAAELAGQPLAEATTRPRLAAAPAPTPAMPDPTPPVVTPPAPAAVGAATVRRGRARWPLLVAGAALAALALGLVAVALGRGTGRGGAPPTAEPGAAPVAVVPTSSAPAGTPTASPTAAPSVPAVAAGSPTANPTRAPTPTVSATQPPASPAPSAAAPNPSDTLVGQRVRSCTYGVEFDIAVARTEWTKTVTGQPAAGNGMWVVAFLDVTNAGTKAESLVTRPVQLRDAAGRQYNVREYPPDPVELARAYGVKGAFTTFEPGITEQTVVTFQVPQDIGPLTLAGKRDFC